MNRPDFELILDKCLEGTATPEEEAQAATAARQSSELNDTLLRELGIHAALASFRHDDSAFADAFMSRITRSGQSDAFAARVRERFDEQEPSDVRPDAARRRPRVARFPSETRSWGWRITGVAAALLIALGLGVHVALQRLSLAAPAPFATVTHARGDVLVVGPHGQTAVDPDDRIEPGATVVTRRALSAATLRTPDGAELQLGSDSRATFCIQPGADRADGARGVHLAIGAMRAEVPRTHTAALAFTTPHAEVQILATRFSLAVDALSTRVEVARGEVQFTRTSDSKTVAVRAGHYAVAAEGVALAAKPLAEGRTPATAARVTVGLCALYTFGAGGGNTVRDASGVGGPLDLQIDDPQAVAWIRPAGLTVRSPAVLASRTPATKIIYPCRASNEITIEAWITPKIAAQGGGLGKGAARIVSISANPTERNVTIGIDISPHPEGSYEARLRTTTTDPNAGVFAPHCPARASLTHLVYTRGATGKDTFYVDGVPGPSGVSTGTFDNWANTFHLVLANEFTGNRPWLGTLHLVALYSRCLTPEEVQRNFTAGL
ncbi:MAG: FecR domain-containing protein [Kiritimatiellae bacterium]|nr:FecR domain-containing protein [Kiritimatiellia bacterium]